MYAWLKRDNTYMNACMYTNAQTQVEVWTSSMCIYVWIHMMLTQGTSLYQGRKDIRGFEPKMDRKKKRSSVLLVKAIHQLWREKAWGKTKESEQKSFQILSRIVIIIFLGRASPLATLKTEIAQIYLHKQLEFSCFLLVF